MPVRSAVRDAQRQLAVLDAAYARSRDRLERACARRAVVAAEHDHVVSNARAAVEAAVADMVVAVGPAMAAELLGLELVDVRRVARRRVPPGETAASPRRTERSDLTADEHASLPQDGGA